jgi:hypothetical protein
VITGCRKCGEKLPKDVQDSVGEYYVRVHEFSKRPPSALSQDELRKEAIFLLTHHQLGVESTEGKKRLEEIDARLKEFPLNPKPGNGEQWIVRSETTYL